MKRVCLTTIIVVAAVALAGLARAQLFGPKMKKPGELIQKQAPMKVNQDLLKQATPENTRIVVSIPKQRAYLMIGEEIVADAPVSSGKRGHESPRGHMRVLEKDPNHHSTLYGDFVDGSGRIVRGGVSARIDSAPSGTHFAGAAMKWFLRLTEDGVGMHIGILPGYPASHGCIRESVDGAKLFYDHAKVGTPVDVGDF
ncbi:MAG TPA: L,D-transpeptidase family protein [Chthoniobacterales bacterium]|jgi:lipoprotein-anchoring transpeptidase ErfK/SrfK|nr:L,D-transpeptidase family protein [Chthoniobacterales bacterium]